MNRAPTIVSLVRALALLLVTCAFTSLAAQTTTWTGALGTNWHDSANWSNGLPSPTVDAIVPSPIVINTTSPSGFMPRIHAAVATCRSFTIAGGSTLTLDANFELHGGATFNGSVLGPAKLRLVGAGTIGGTSILPSIEVASTGLVQFNSSVIGGNLVLLNGRVRPQANTVCTIQGDAEFRGGIVEATGSSSVFRILGTTRFIGAACTVSPNLQCGGDFEADAGYQPINLASVVIDAPTPTLIRSLAPDHRLRMSQLVVRNGQRIADSQLVLDVDALVIEANGELNTDDEIVELPGGIHAIAGHLSVGAGGELRLPPSATLHVLSSGKLSLLGVQGTPACVTSIGAAGYRVIVDGEIAGRNFLVENAGVDGVEITSQATFAPFPYDLRGGRFENLSPLPGSTLLTLSRTSSVTLAFLEFVGPTTGLVNVRYIGSSPSHCVNWSGPISGPAFEDDPAGLFTWNPPTMPPLMNLQFVAAAERAIVRYFSVDESELFGYELERSTSPTGPFMTVTSQALAGDGAFYEFVDDGILPGVTYTYRLVGILDFNVRSILASQTLVPFSAQVSNVAEVVPGVIANPIQEALAAADPTNAVIRLAPGTYPSFTIDGSHSARIRIIGSNTAPSIIDASVVSVVIENRNDPTVVEFVDLEFIGPSNEPAIIVRDGSGTVLLENVLVDGTAGSGMTIDQANAVIVQNSTFLGALGLQLSDSAQAQLTRTTTGQITVANASTLHTCEAASSPVLVSSNSNQVAAVGGMPHIVMQREVSAGLSFQVGMFGEPLQPWYLGIADSPRWSFLTTPTVELNFLLNPALGAHLFGAGTLDATGFGIRRVTVPALPQILGIAPSFQFITVVAQASSFRFSDVQSILVVP